MSRPVLPRTLVALSLAVPTAAFADDPFAVLGSAGDYTLAGLADAYTGTSSGFVQLGSEAHVYGDIGACWRLETAAGVIVEGDADHGSGGVLHGGSVRGSDSRLSDASWEAIRADAHNTVEAAFALDASVLSGSPAASCLGTPTATGSMGSLTLTSDPDEDGLTVYEIDGCLFLGDGETLTVEGRPDDRFVIRVTGGLRLDGGSAITLTGLPGSAVMFVFDAGGWASEPWAQVTVWNGAIDHGAALSGLYVAPWMYWQLGDGTDMPDTRILAGGVQANIQDMHSTGVITGVPEETDPGADTGDPQDDDPGYDPGFWLGDRCPPRITASSSSSGSDRGTTRGSSDAGDDSSESANPGASGSCGLGVVPASGAMAVLGLAAVGWRRRRD